MSAIDHFSFGLLTPLLAYLMSCAGSLLGLQCTARARGASGQSRARWLLLAAVSIGGTGIWVMHFIAMLGFRVEGIEIKYEVGLTLLSMLIAIVVVGIGLFIVGFGGARRSALIAGGVITGLGVASMHYMGMGAMAMAGHVDYDALLVAASVLIAVVAATVALWFTLRVKGHLTTVAAALVMGVAISGMHYTGMAAMQVRGDPDSATPAGASAFDFLLPLVVGISLLAVIMLVIIGLSPTEDELNLEEEFNRSLQHASAGAALESVPSFSQSGQSGQSGQEGRDGRDGRDGYWLRGQDSS